MLSNCVLDLGLSISRPGLCSLDGCSLLIPFRLAPNVASAEFILSSVAQDQGRGGQFPVKEDTLSGVSIRSRLVPVPVHVKMELRDGLQEALLTNSPSPSSDSSWTSYDCSTDLTSVSSDPASTPLVCRLFQAFGPKKPASSRGRASRVVLWTETSFLGDDK